MRVGVVLGAFMKKVTGQFLRLVGLLVEMLGIMGVLTGRGDIEAARLRLPSGTLVSPAWIAIALGFAIWMVGTILVFRSRSRRVATLTRKSLWPFRPGDARTTGENRSQIPASASSPPWMEELGD